MQTSVMMLDFAHRALQPSRSTDAQWADLYELAINSAFPKWVVSAVLPEMSQNDLLPGSNVWQLHFNS